jgi:hypothetical protein
MEMVALCLCVAVVPFTIKGEDRNIVFSIQKLLDGKKGDFLSKCINSTIHLLWLLKAAHNSRFLTCNSKLANHEYNSEALSLK